MSRPVSHKHVANAEILSVTSAMRKNSRWAVATHRALYVGDSALARDLGLRKSGPLNPSAIARSGTREADLMVGFLELKSALREVEDVKTMALPTLLSPFFAIIRSPLSTGPITSAALASLHTFFASGLISEESIGLDVAMAELSNAVSRCKFEASNSSGDEVVLLRIMTVIKDCMCSASVGPSLGDVEVCEMLETVLTTCCQMRLSEILRRSAESTMHDLVRTIFSKLHTLDPETEEAKLIITEEESQEGEIKLNVTTSQNIAGQDDQSDDPHLTAKPQEDDESTLATESKPEVTVATTYKPEFGLPAIIELLRVLINILDPTDQVHTDSTRLTALAVLNTAFEVSGSRMSDFPSLSSLITDSGCKFLFQLARSENLSILHLALRTIGTVFETTRKLLKLQLELFLVFSIDKLAASSPSLKRTPHLSSPRPVSPARINGVETETLLESTPTTPRHPLVTPAKGETRDLILETLNQISRQPSFMVDLYTNYDCDVNCDNLFERLVDFLTKGVYSSHYAGGFESHQESSQYNCLDMLLAMIDNMVKRSEGREEAWSPDHASLNELRSDKSRKEVVITGASLFNAKPKQGLAYLAEHGLIYADISPEISEQESLARFLKSCSRLDKRLLGDYLSRPENIKILEAFIGLFEFKNKPIADAMREMLEAFRLPGESQQIARITETFAAIYFAAGQDEVKSQDAVYVLAYSVIMLNTDLHNPQVRRRMAIEDYKRNLRGVNRASDSTPPEESDFSPEYLQNIYDSIRKREIIMPEEHTGQLGFEYAWKELLARSRLSGNFVACNSSAFDKEMFKATWKSVVSAITYAFISFDDDPMIQRAIAGFRQCATLAGLFELPDVFDFIVVSLSQATSLLSEDLPTQVPNYPVVEIEGQPLTVSSLSVKFGTNFKGQLAAVVLFNIVNGHGNALREGWTQIFEMFQNLFLHSALPKRMLQMEDFLGGVSMIPLRGAQPERTVARNDGGLLSALSSYLMTPYGSSSDQLIPDATDADVEKTLCTMDCIASCRLDELYGQIMLLDIDALVAAVRALEALAHERTVARLKQDSEENYLQTNEKMYSVPYDPAAVFLLETMLSISQQASQHIEELWPIVFEHLRALLSTPTQYSILLIERAVVGLLRMCLLLSQQPTLRDQIYISFDLISSLPSIVANSVAEQVIHGVTVIINTDREIIRSQTEWNLVFAVIRSTLSNPEASRCAFDLLERLSLEGPDEFVTADNFAGMITVLDEFASMASIAVETMHKAGGRRAKIPLAADSLPIARGQKAVDLVFNLKRFISTFVEAGGVSRHRAWKHFSLPLLTSLARQSANAAREVRHIAIGHLQRFMLGPQIVYDDKDHSQLEEIFNRLLFPLLDELLKPAVFQRDASGMPETRLRVSALLCKAFMHFEIRDRVAPQHDLRIVWIQILDLLDRIMNDDRENQLLEAIPESLKNVILVMNASNILVPPSVVDDREEQQRTFWVATHERMERFLPGFLAEVINMPEIPPISGYVADVPSSTVNPPSEQQ